MKEHDRVVLLKDLPDEGFRKNDVGTIVHIHRQGEALEVEFMTRSGQTVAVAALPCSDVREVTSSDITHARALAGA